MGMAVRVVDASALGAVLFGEPPMQNLRALGITRKRHLRMGGLLRGLQMVGSAKAPALLRRLGVPDDIGLALSPGSSPTGRAP